MDHSSHQNMDHNHDHMDHSNHMNHDSMSIAEVVNSTVVSNLTKMLIQGAKMAAETVSDLSQDDSLKQGVHHGHDMDMSGSSTMDMDHMNMEMTMPMYFHFGYDEYVLFYGWHITTVGGLIGSMIGIFLIAVFYEGLKFTRELLFKRSISSMQLYGEASNKGLQNSREVPLQLNMWSSGHMTQTLLHMLQFIISYCLMLIFMTYNVWLCLACTLGAGFGYFLFGWKKSVVVDVTEHCH